MPNSAQFEARVSTWRRDSRSAMPSERSVVGTLWSATASARLRPAHPPPGHPQALERLRAGVPRGPGGDRCRARRCRRPGPRRHARPRSVEERPRPAHAFALCGANPLAGGGRPTRMRRPPRPSPLRLALDPRDRVLLLAGSRFALSCATLAAKPSASRRCARACREARGGNSFARRTSPRRTISIPRRSASSSGKHPLDALAVGDLRAVKDEFEAAVAPGDAHPSNAWTRSREPRPPSPRPGRYRRERSAAPAGRR